MDVNIQELDQALRKDVSGCHITRGEKDTYDLANDGGQGERIFPDVSEFVGEGLPQPSNERLIYEERAGLRDDIPAGNDDLLLGAEGGNAMGGEEQQGADDG